MILADPLAPVTIGAFVTGALGLIAAALAYLVQRRSVAVVEMESVVKALSDDNADLREQIKELRGQLRTAELRIFELERKEHT